MQLRYASYTMLTVTYSCSKCCVSSGHDFEAATGLCCTLTFVFESIESLYM